MDVQTYHTYVSDLLLFLFVSCKSRVGSSSRKTCLKKLSADDKIRRDYIRRDNCKMLH